MPPNVSSACFPALIGPCEETPEQDTEADPKAVKRQLRQEAFNHAANLTRTYDPKTGSPNEVNIDQIITAAKAIYTFLDGED